jgi:hypothetical protein
MTFPVRPFYTGLGFDASKLPAGWTLLEDAKCWAYAVSPEGRKFYLSENGLNPGQTQVDEEAGVVYY